MLLLIFAQKSYNSCKTTLHNTIGLMDFRRKLQLHNWGTSIQHTINKISIQCHYKLMFNAGRRVPRKANFQLCSWNVLWAGTRGPSGTVTLFLAMVVCVCVSLCLDCNFFAFLKLFLILKNHIQSISMHAFNIMYQNRHIIKTDIRCKFKEILAQRARVIALL